LAALFFIFYPFLVLSAPQNSFLKKQKHFIKDLYQQKRYFDLVGETRKLLIYDADQKKHEHYKYLINSFYFLGGQYQTVVNNLEENRETLDEQTKILLSQSLLFLNHSKEALSILEKVSYQKDSFFNLNLFQRRVEVSAALGDFKTFSLELDKKFFLEESKRDDFKRLKINLSKIERINLKSTLGATTLSAIFPGAGHFYSGLYSAGIFSFLGVFVPASLSYFLYKKKEKELGACFAFFTASFYFGNIYSAYRSTQSKNLSLKKNFWEKISSYLEPYDPLRTFKIEDW